MAVTQLGIYNEALTLMGARPLVTTTDAAESQRVLTSVYPDVKQYCLEQAVWSFAMRASSCTQTGGGLAGLTYVFNKPADIIHLFTASISSSYDQPLASEDFIDDGPYFFANASPLYVRYSSNDATSYGGLLTRWNTTFGLYVAAALASFTCVRITGSASYLPVLAKREEMLLQRAKKIDEINKLPGKLPFNQDARNTRATQFAQFDPVPGTENEPAQPQRGQE